MKNLIKITGCLVLSMVLSATTQAWSQDCSVLLKEISTNYKGECKGGFASGKGEATGNGYTYQGEFKKGYPDGEGALTLPDGTVFKSEWKKGMIWGYGELTAKDGSVKKGYWKGNITDFIYVGVDKDYLLGYKILDTQFMDNATIEFVKNKESLDKLVIQIYENHIRRIDHFEILGITSGVIHQVVNNNGRLTADIINISFPLTMQIRYILPYGTQDTKLMGGEDNLFSPRVLRFTIVEPGLWTVTITHR